MGAVGPATLDKSLRPRDYPDKACGARPWEWLRGLDLGECEGHRIDGDVMVRLMADDLKKIDASAVGESATK